MLLKSVDKNKLQVQLLKPAWWWQVVVVIVFIIVTAGVMSEFTLQNRRTLNMVHCAIIVCSTNRSILAIMQHCCSKNQTNKRMAAPTCCCIASHCWHAQLAVIPWYGGAFSWVQHDVSLSVCCIVCLAWQPVVSGSNLISAILVQQAQNWNIIDWRCPAALSSAVNCLLSLCNFAAPACKQILSLFVIGLSVVVGCVCGPENDSKWLHTWKWEIGMGLALAVHWWCWGKDSKIFLFPFDCWYYATFHWGLLFKFLGAEHQQAIAPAEWLPQPTWSAVLCN